MDRARRQEGLDGEVTRIIAGVGARPVPPAVEIASARELLATRAPARSRGSTTALGLSTGEEALVAAAWWAEADPQLAIVLGCAHDDAGRRHASAALLRLVLEPYGLNRRRGWTTARALVSNGCSRRARVRSGRCS